MEFKIRKDEFLRGLYLAHGIADRKSTLPILANVLLRTEGKDKLLCGATDLNVTTMVSLSAKVEKEGGLTVAARQLYEIVKGLPDDEVRVRRTEQNWAEIRSGKVEFKVVGMSDRDYPKLPAIQEAQTSKVDSAVLRDMIAKTIFSVSLDETRQHLAGVLFESDGTTARMVSTDGHRLSKVSRPLPGRAEAGDRRADSAQGHRRAAARDRDARGAERDRHPRRQLRAQGGRRRHLGQADRRAVPALRPGDPQGQRARVRGVAPGVPGRAQARGADVVGQDLRRAAGAREGEAAHRERQPRPGRGEGRDRRRTTRGRRSRSASTPATSSTCSPRSRRPRCASSCRASWIPAVVRPADGSDYVCVVMPMRL